MTIELCELEQLDAGRTRDFGGKACGLARLIGTGVDVPSGFAVSATCEPPARWSAEAIDALRERLRPLLREGPVAVRSSAVGEDGAERSFAGLFESVLGVESEEAALDALARCIGSGASQRVRSYAGGDEATPVGVVVQHLVDARTSGVLFTRDPAGRARGMVIEAVAGLGEALVSGHATPVRWRIHRAGGATLEAHPEPGAEDGPLAGITALRLGDAAQALERELRMPLDLEWAQDASGRIWFVQARPITAAAPPPPLPVVDASCPDAEDGAVTVWTNINVRETMPDPVTPLAWSLWRDRMMHHAVSLSLDLEPDDPRVRHLVMADRVNGRAYWNVNAMLAMPGVGPLTPRMFDIIDGTALASFEALQERGLPQPRRLPVRGAALWGAGLRANLKGVPFLLRALRPERSLERFRQRTAAMQRRRLIPLAPRGDADLADEIREVTSDRFLGIRELFTSLFLAIGAFGLARHAFRHHPEAQRLVGVGLRNNPTTQMSVALDELTAAARPVAGAFLETDSAEALLGRLETLPEGQAFMNRLAGFLDWNGQRGPKEFDLHEPRWSDDPSMLLEIVRVNLKSPPAEPVATRLAGLEKEREQAIASAIRASSPWKRPLLRAAARLATRHLPLREGGKHHVLSAIHRTRQLVVELGDRLAARGALARADDVFFLDFAELDALACGRAPAAALREAVAERRAEFARFPTGDPPGFLRSDGVPVPSGQPEPGEDGVLRGVGISTGEVRGTVRILTAPDPTAFQDGEILVVRLADPGWTPLFPRAGGLVMEVGGLMCHAAVVARELGLPAVFGVGNATEALQDGQTVLVDAEAGSVTPL